MRIIEKENGIEISSRIGNYCFSLTVICGDITIVSAHRSIFGRAIALDACKMPSCYVPPFALSMNFFKKAMSSLPPGEYFFYGEDDGRRVRVYKKALTKMGIDSFEDGSVIRFKI